MPSCGTDNSPEYFQELSRRREAYRQKLIAKGVVDGSRKMQKLMIRKGL